VVAARRGGSDSAHMHWKFPASSAAVASVSTLRHRQRPRQGRTTGGPSIRETRSSQDVPELKSGTPGRSRMAPRQRASASVWPRPRALRPTSSGTSSAGRSALLTGHFGESALRLLLTDAVEKLGDEHRARNKRIGVNGCLNQRCVRDSPVESKVALVRSPQIFFSTASTQCGHLTSR
jgi:hypothetical protein